MHMGMPKSGKIKNRENIPGPLVRSPSQVLVAPVGAHPSQADASWHGFVG
jgi:hypothetical protein